MILRDAWRALRSSTGSTVFSFIVLTAAIASATTTFSVVDAVVLRSLPYADGDRLVRVGPDERTVSTENQFTAWSERADAFSSMAAGGMGPVVQFPTNAGLDIVRAWPTTASLFDVLGVRPVLGRVFAAEHQVNGRNTVAVISYDTWQKYFGGAPEVLGKVLRFSDARWAASVEIIGVMPPGFTNYFTAHGAQHIWIPLVIDGPPGGNSGRLHVIGRLREGVAIESAQAQVDTISQAVIAEQKLKMRPGWQPPRLRSLQDSLVGGVKAWMILVLAAAVLVMLVACANVANLMLAQSASRSRELALRVALGGSPIRLGGTVLVESLLLSSGAAAAGLLLSIWGVEAAIATLQNGRDIPRLETIAINLRVFAMAAGTALVSGLCFGSVPAWRSFRSAPILLINSGGGGATVVHGKWRAAFLTTQFALVATLVVVSVLFVTSYIRVIKADLGFDPSNLVSIALTGFHGTTDALTHALRNTASVASVAEIAHGIPPIAKDGQQRFATLASTSGRGAHVTVLAAWYEVSSNYFETAGIHLLRGRPLQSGDPEDVVVIDDLTAQVLLGSARDPAGAQVFVDSRPLAVVGVVRTVKQNGPEEPPAAQVYVMKRAGAPAVQYLLRTSASVDRMRPAIAATLARSFPPNAVLPEMQSIESLLGGLAVGRRANARLMGGLGLIVLLIGAAGVYAVMSTIVVQQTRELGIRRALGATTAHLVGGTMVRVGSYLAVGIAIGLMLGQRLSRVFEGLLFGVSPAEPWTYVVVSALLVGAGLMAALLPSVRAARVDPLVALRAE